MDLEEGRAVAAEVMGGVGRVTEVTDRRQSPGVSLFACDGHDSDAIVRNGQRPPTNPRLGLIRRRRRIHLALELAKDATRIENAIFVGALIEARERWQSGCRGCSPRP